MPISRYEIRNEYSLADPDLYRSADKDDPESLLEGVAMAGLVGVLRQLGDLAEFAADIFHNLHEEATATAARSHGLVVRVQQLETEIPHIERVFLSQTDHSLFFNHTGVDWHPNLRIDQNLITQGDLPRMVMDSYEECRPPPRLFLLDKFDIAGAGACLKRYSDPSFFKVENSGITNADVALREKKIRKSKKKGPHWKTDETTEVLPTSHTKLHQLFMEEVRVENGGSNPSRNAKLKRKLNGFPFNTKSGKSYMDKFLEHTSPDNKVVHEEVTVNSSSLPSATFEYNESGLQVVEVRQVSPHRENVWRERSPPSFIDKGEIIVNSSIGDKIREAPNLYPGIATDIGISSTHSEKIIDMDSCREGSLTGYQWDDNGSEADNYVDATSTVGSDTDANSTLRVNNDFAHSHVKSGLLISDPNEENLQTMSFDSGSTGGSIISEEDNNSSGKGMSTFSSNSPSTSVENPQSERVSTRVFSSEVVDHSEHIVSDVSFPNKNKADNGSEKVTSDLLHWGVSDRKGQNSGENSAFKFNLFDVHSWDTIGNPGKVNSSETLPGQLDDEFLEETSSADAETIDDGDNQSERSIGNQSHLEKNSNLPWTGDDAHERNVIPKEYMTVNEDVVPGTLKEPAWTSEYVEMGGTRSKGQEVKEYVEGHTHTLSMEDNSDTAGMVSTVPALSNHASTGHEVTKSSGSNDLISLNEVHVPLDETDKSSVADMASLVPVLSDSVIVVNKLVEEKVHSFVGSGIDEPENVNNSLSESHWKLSLEENVNQTKAATSGFENNDQPHSEVLHVTDYEVAEETIVQVPDLLGPILPPSETDLVNTPPLPPLPPAQWMMMGKPQFGSSLFPTESTDGDDDAGSSSCPPTASTNDCGSPLEEITHSPIQTSNEPPSKEKPQLHLSSTEIEKSTIQIPDKPTSKEESVEFKDNPSKEKPQLHLSSTEVEVIQHNELVSNPIVCTDEIKKSPIQIPDKPASKEESVEVKDNPTSKEEKTESSRMGVSPMNETVDFPPVSENKQQQSVMKTEEAGVANGSQVVKQPHLPHPLVGEFTALDKNRLRKVTERLKPPQEQKVDGRNSMLEQIRTKSFNLKPALATRPSYRGPSTNLKIAAIVEKANAIRQAFADSDEDDDSWSDS